MNRLRRAVLIGALFGWLTLMVIAADALLVAWFGIVGVVLSIAVTIGVIAGAIAY